jgi:hypothetical protein
MKKLYSLFALIAFSVTMLNAQVQNVVIAKRGDSTIARDKFDGKALFSNRSSSIVFQQAADLLYKNKGGTIEVLNGLYEIDSTIVINKNVSVIGSGKSTRFKLSIVNAQNRGIIFLADRADNCTLADFTCIGIPSHNKSAGVVIDSTGFATVRNLFTINFSGYGIWLRNRCFGCKIDNNFTARNGKAGTFISDINTSRGGWFAPNKISGGYSYYEEGNAFEFSQAICQDIVGCVAYLAKGHGIYMHSQSTSNLISGNRIFMCYGNGITIENTYEMNISSNICGWNNGINLLLDHCVWATVSANEFIDAGGRRDPQYSIYMKNGTKSVQIGNNAIFNWWDNQIMRGGVYEDTSCLENQITDNIVNYYKEDAVKALGTNTIAAFNLGLPHAYGSPHKGPNTPNVSPENIELRGDLDDAKKRADKYFSQLINELLN